MGDHAAGVSDGATMSFVDTHFLSNHLASLYDSDDDSHLSVVIADVGFSGVGNTAVRHLRGEALCFLNVSDGSDIQKKCCQLITNCYIW